MDNETRRKNIITYFNNVYSTYSTSEMFGYRSSRGVSNLTTKRLDDTFPYVEYHLERFLF